MERHARDAEHREALMKLKCDEGATRDAYARMQAQLFKTQQELKVSQKALRELREASCANSSLQSEAKPQSPPREALAPAAPLKQSPVSMQSPAKLSPVKRAQQTPWDGGTERRSFEPSPPRTPAVADRVQTAHTPAFGVKTAKQESPAMSPVELDTSNLFGSPPTFQDHENEDPNANAFSPVKRVEFTQAHASPAKPLRWPTNGNPTLASPARGKTRPSEVVTARVGGGYHVVEVTGAYRDPRTGLEHPAGRVQVPQNTRGRAYYVLNATNPGLATCRPLQR